QITIRPATAEAMPTARRMLSGISIALFMARRMKAGLAANRMPSSTNRIPTPMRKSTNAMDLIGPRPPRKWILVMARGAKRNRLGGGVGVGDDHGHLTVGLGADLLRLLPALGAELGGFALALGLHALIHRLAVGVRQIGTANAHVDHLDAVALGLVVELGADL